MRRIRIDWDGMIRSLVLVRLGQELGTQSELAKAVAAGVEFALAVISKLTS